MQYSNEIAVFTLYDAYNYGSFLQAFALQEFINSKGKKAVLIDCSTDKFRWLKRVIAFSFRREYIKIQRRVSYGKAWKKLSIRKYNNAEYFNTAVIGSDEIWNISNPYFEHWKQYFGAGIKAKKVIAYAPSIGYTKPKTILDNQGLCDQIKKIDICFARDKSTQDLLENIVGHEVLRVCDPTILLFDSWQKYEKPVSINDPYILLYGYSTDFSVKEEIINFAKLNKLKIVSAGFDCTYADKVIIGTPFQFLWLIHHADYVVTGTFHGTVFSTIYNKNFVVESDMQKTVDFLHLTHQEKRLIHAKEDFENIQSVKRNVSDLDDLQELMKFSGNKLSSLINAER